MHVCTPREISGNSNGEEKVSKDKVCERKYETKLEFPSCRGFKPKRPVGGFLHHDSNKPERLYIHNQEDVSLDYKSSFSIRFQLVILSISAL